MGVTVYIDSVDPCHVHCMFVVALVLGSAWSQHSVTPLSTWGSYNSKIQMYSRRVLELPRITEILPSNVNVPNVIFDTGAKQCQCPVWWIHTTCGGSHPLLVMHACKASASDYTWCTIIDHLIALLLWWECVQRLHGLAMATLLSHRPCQERMMTPSSH